MSVVTPGPCNTPMKAGVFPLPLLPGVLDVLEGTSPIKEDHWCSEAIRDLRNCALVHSTWLAPSQARLKYRIKLHPCKRNRDYELRNWSDLGIENIGPWTQVLALVCSCFTPRCACENRYKTIIPNAPNLRVLLLSNIALRSADYLRLLGILPAIQALPRLEALSLRVKQDRHLPQLFEILNEIPLLRTLSLKLFLDEDDDPLLLENLHARKFPLKSLRFYHGGKGNFPLCALAWLLRPQTGIEDGLVSELFINARESRHVTRQQRTMLQDEQTFDVFQALQFVKIVGWIKDHIPAWKQSLSRCTSLQYLVIDIDFDEYEDEPSNFREFIGYLPRSLEFLAMDFRYSMPLDWEWEEALVEMDGLIAAVITSNLTRLRAINIFTGLTEEVVFPKTREVCRERGILAEVECDRCFELVPDPWVF